MRDRIRAALATILVAASLIAAAPPAHAGPVEERISVRNKAGVQATYWWAHKTQPGNDEATPDRVDLCGVDPGQTVRATFTSASGGSYYTASAFPAVPDGCSTILVSPTSTVDVGYAGANPITYLTLTVDGQTWQWVVGDGTGQLAPTDRPSLSTPALQQDFTAQ